MTKFVLPLLVFACAGFSQDKEAPKVDPSTGLPKKVDVVAKMLADVLRGASMKKVKWEVIDPYGVSSDIALDAGLKESIETKLKLGMKRNKLSFDAIHSSSSFSKIVVEVSANQVGTRVFGYNWTVDIGRYVNTPDGEEIQHLAKWKVAGGVVGNAAALKDRIDSTLDKIFLAYLELPEKKKQTLDEFIKEVNKKGRRTSERGRRKTKSSRRPFRIRFQSPRNNHRHASTNPPPCCFCFTLSGSSFTSFLVRFLANLSKLGLRISSAARL